MEIPPKYIQFLIKILFTIVFIIHTSFIALKIWKPDVPEIRIIKKHLKDIELPLSFKLCVHDTENSRSRFQKYGYNYDYDFYRGKSMFNGSIYGWNGHNKFGFTVGPVKGESFY